MKSQADIFLASLAPGQQYEAPLAKVGDEVVAMCADTKHEFVRWTIVLRQGYDKMTRSILGKEYVKRIWTDPVEQKVVLGVWTNWRRLLTPKLLDYDMSHWDEPMDDPVTGKVAIPFEQRFPYYLVTRHQVLSCFFVGARDSFSQRTPADLMNTLMWTYTYRCSYRRRHRTQGVRDHFSHDMISRVQIASESAACNGGES